MPPSIQCATFDIHCNSSGVCSSISLPDRWLLQDYSNLPLWSTVVSLAESIFAFQSNAVDKPKIRGVAKCTKGGNKYPPNGAGNHLVIKNAATIGNSGLKAVIHLGKYVGRKKLLRQTRVSLQPKRQHPRRTERASSFSWSVPAFPSSENQGLAFVPAL